MQQAKPAREERREKKLSLAKLIIVFSAMITLLYCALVIDRAFKSYNEAIEYGKADSRILMQTVLDHVELTFLAVDLTLKRAIDREYFDLLFGKNLIEDMRNSFAIWVGETSQLAGMMMVNEKGDITAIERKEGYEKWMENVSNIAVKKMFTFHKNDENNEKLYIGWQESFIKNHSGFVILSRRINNLDGEFGGIMVSAVNGDYIMNFFNAIEKDKETELLIIKKDGMSLAGNIADVRVESEVLDALEMRGAFDVSNKDDKIYVVESYSNDELKLFSTSGIINFGVLIAIISHEGDILAHWNSQRINDIIFLSIFALFVVAISYFAVAVSRQMRKAHSSERAALTASQAKSDFLANMSHELRTPLNAIIGFSEMLSAGYFGTMNPQQKERVKDVHNCGTHLLSVINDILEFSKGEAGKLTLRNEEVSLPRVIKDTIRMFGEKQKKKDIKILFDENKEFKMPRIIADSRKIKQILINLLSNAVKFAGEKGVVEVFCGVNEKREPFFSVQDDGIGMKEEDIQKALSVFGQVHDIIDFNDIANEGTGLGLPLCKMFAELHGGKLTVKSAPNKGALITVTLPAEKIIWSSSEESIDIGDAENVNPLDKA